MTVPTPTHSWRFDETTGNIAADSTGGADITLDRDDGWVPGKFGNHPQGRPWPGGYDLPTRKRDYTVPLYLGTSEPDLVTNKRNRTEEGETSWR